MAPLHYTLLHISRSNAILRLDSTMRGDRTMDKPHDRFRASTDTVSQMHVMLLTTGREKAE